MWPLLLWSAWKALLFRSLSSSPRKGCSSGSFQTSPVFPAPTHTAVRSRFESPVVTRPSRLLLSRPLFGLVLHSTWSPPSTVVVTLLYSRGCSVTGRGRCRRSRFRSLSGPAMEADSQGTPFGTGTRNSSVYLERKVSGARPSR